MPLIPLFVQNEVGTDAANRLSAFNFCDPFDHVLPPVDSTVSALDRQHLWGMYVGIAAAAAEALSSVIVRTVRQGPLIAYWIWWLSDDDGNASKVFQPDEFEGRPFRTVTAPLQPAPSANYNITMLSPLLNDILAGNLANRSDSSVEQVWNYDVLSDAHHRVPTMHCRYELAVSNAGSGKAGLLVIYCWQGGEPHVPRGP